MSNPKVPQRDDKPSNLKKDPDDWTTGDEPMTDAQASYLKTLSEEAGDDNAFDPGLSKAERRSALTPCSGRPAAAADYRALARYRVITPPA